MPAFLGIEPTKEPNYYFVSYNSDDAKQLQPLIRLLDRNGFPLWYDEGLKYGVEWDADIADHIQNCQAVLLMMTNSVLHKQNTFVNTEYEMATKHFKKPVYVIMVDDIAEDQVPNGSLSWWIDIKRKRNLSLSDYKGHDDVFIQEMRKMLNQDASPAADSAGNSRKAGDVKAPEAVRPTADTGRKKTPVALIAGIAALCLVIAGAAIYFSHSGNKNTSPAISAEPAATEQVAETPSPEPSALPANSALVSAAVGDTVTYGVYEQDGDKANGAEEIEWIVLDKDTDRILLLSKYALDTQYYNDSQVSTSWKMCSLRQWLNDDFYQAAFTADEQKFISESEISNTGTGMDTEDNLFLLNISEVKNYFSQKADRLCEATDYAVKNGAFVNNSNGYTMWWLRDAGSSSEKAAYVISRDGSCDAEGDSVKTAGYGVRPAMWVSLAD